jgi:hypothetical protein
MINGPVKVFEISDITDTSRANSIEVVLAGSGKKIRFARSQVEIEYHRIIVAEWLVLKMEKSLCGGGLVGGGTGLG